MSPELLERVKHFTTDPNPPVECRHKHQLQGSGAVFFQGVGLIQCGECYGWQFIRKPVRTK